MKIWTTLRMFLGMTVLTGIIYPLIVTAIAQLAMKQKADGSFVSSNERLVGSTLIAQKFEMDKYFWGRPSAIDYNPLPSGGSNLAATSEHLKQQVHDRKEKILKTQNNKNEKIPSELLFASGSGIDPHITPYAARFQVDRILKARGLDQTTGKKDVENLIEKETNKRIFGFLGEPTVNVLLLNIALDKLSHP